MGNPSMADTQQCLRDDVNVCLLCGQLENLSVCGACKSVWYCSKSHQILDWKKHKQVCQRVDTVVNRNSDRISGVNKKNLTCKNETVLIPMKENRSGKVPSSSSSSENAKLDSSTDASCYEEKTGKESFAGKEITNPKGCEPETAQVKSMAKSRQTKTSSISMKNKSHRKESSLTHGPQQRYYLEQTSQIFNLPPSVSELSKNKKRETDAGMGNDTKTFPTLESRSQYLMILQSRFDEVSKYVVKCLTQYGICVVDKFLGEATAQEIFKEVFQLQLSGVMTQGQLVSGPSSASKNKHIRGDDIAWVDGTESKCENIHYLISCMDTVMLQGARNLKNCIINERTKAMVACYPGEGRGYIRHVDNPNGDGRCVTCIYYLNKDWDVRRDGGLLRIHPEGSDNVANIEPVMDRLLFFWSDRRNPHEVENAMKQRYAITVWYYDADERAEALQRLKVHSSQDVRTRLPSSATSPASLGVEVEQT